MMRAALVVATLVFASACAGLVGIDTNLALNPSNDGGGSPETAPAAEAAPYDAPAADVDAATTPPPVRPPEGTYVYSISGQDQMTGFVNSQLPYGPTATATIAYEGADCFTQTFVFRNGYTETMHLCIRGLEVVEDSEQRDQTFSGGISAHTTTTCTPGDVYFSTAATVGTSFSHFCTGKNTDDKSGNSAFRVSGTYVYDGDEGFQVMGQYAVNKRFKDERTVRDSQTGTNSALWYYSASGVLRRLHRQVDIDYPTAFGTIHYHETLDMLLTATPGGDAGHD